MPCDTLPPSNLISFLSHQLPRSLNGMISITDAAKFSTIQRNSPSSIGFLDNLPLELLHLVLESLDFQSLSRFLCVSLRGKAIVESLPAYRALMEFAPHVLKGLGMTGLISYHSSAVLHATLLSSQCVSCGEFGIFLFLPTCERCCYECLDRNQSLWVIPVALARKCFKVTQSQLRDTRIMRSLPGIYSVGQVISRRRSLRLISVRDAKELAIKIHGSVEYVTGLAGTRPAPGAAEKAFKDYYTFKYLVEAPLQPLQQNLSKVPSEGNIPPDDYCGMASMHFPSLFPGKALENGFWCLGCEWTYGRHRYGSLSPSLVSKLVPEGLNPCCFLLAMQNRAWTRAEFLCHIQNCYGAQDLISGLEMTNE